MFALDPPFKLPPVNEREILGVWRMNIPARMHRSIEKVGDQYALVVRFLTREGKRVGGEDGLRLEKVSDREFCGTDRNRCTYRLTHDGELHEFASGEVEPSMVGTRTTQLWPSDA